MRSEVTIQGVILTNYIEVKTNNNNFYYFKLQKKRKQEYSIDKSKHDILHCLVPVSYDGNTYGNLKSGNYVYINGFLQSIERQKNGITFYTTYVIINELHVYEISKKSKEVKIKSVESNIKVGSDEWEFNKNKIRKNNDIKPKVKGTYNKAQYYSSAKPYHDNFPSEFDTRGKIKCLCGNEFFDNLEECPLCKRTVLEIFKKGK